MYRATLLATRRACRHRALGRRSLSEAAAAPAVREVPPLPAVQPHAAAPHTPVMLREVVEFLSGVEDGVDQNAPRLFVDGTVGAGGHARALLEAVPGARLVGIDRDQDAIAVAVKTLRGFGSRAVLARSPFSDIRRVLEACGETSVDGLLLDLGVSSMQLSRAPRGFSFSQTGPIDMRMSGEGETAAELIARLSENELADVLRTYGDERLAGPIAEKLKSRLAVGTLRNTFDVADTCASVYRRFSSKAKDHHRHGKDGEERHTHTINPATRTFQALRIAVNDELGELQRLLADLPAIARPGTRVAVISFHSLEDRIVKRRVRDLFLRDLLEPGRRRDMCATREEREVNPRCRSARARFFMFHSEYDAPIVPPPAAGR